MSSGRGACGAGETLTAVTAALCERLSVGPRILPMSDDPVRTRVLTDAGWLDFQDWFVGRQCRPVVRQVVFAGAATARAQPDFLQAVSAARAIVICPSNPFISVDPILAIPGVREALRQSAAPVIAVSPIIGGRAVKGPTAKLMTEFGLVASAAAVVRHYGDLLDRFVVDAEDAAACDGLGPRAIVTPTLMTTLADRERLARVVLTAVDA